MSLAVADYSGQAWLQGFNDVGVAIFGMSANELLEIRVSLSFLVNTPQSLIPIERIALLPSTT